MTTLCPNCKKAVLWWRLRSEFSCPNCASPLSAKTNKAFIATVVLWILADIPVKLFLFAAFGTESLIGVFARTLVSGIVGWVLASIIVGRFSTITARHA